MANAKAVREAGFKALFERAHAAGMLAGAASRPVPMFVVERENPLDDTSPVKTAYEPVMDGVCGFAWVVIRPGTSSFARWLVKAGVAHKAYRGGVHVWASGFNQSMTRKEAYASAFAEVLRQNGIEHAYADSRID